MDQQNGNPGAPKRVYTEEEIARLEAEAVAALQRGEPIPRPGAVGGDAEAAPQAAPVEAETPQADAPAQPAFVPYVDDAPAPEADDVGDEEDEDEEYIPSAWEQRIDKLTPEQWKRWQIGGGAAVGLLSVAALFGFGEDLATYGLVVAALLAVFLPRYLERAWRRKLTVARTAMVITMAVGLVAMGIVVARRTGLFK